VAISAKKQTNYLSMQKYHNYGELNFAQRSTKRQVLNRENLSSGQIKNLCAGFLTNAIYSDVVEDSEDFERGREQSFEIAANVVLKHGEEIEEQLKKNDEAVARSEFDLEELKDASHEQAVSNHDQPNTSKDVKKISGGTMAKIISKIAEIMASMSPEECSAAANNFSALFVVLGVSFDKIGQSMQSLAETPIVVANIKDVLVDTKGGQVFEKLIETHLSPSQQMEVAKVSKEDLAVYRTEKAQEKTEISRSL
jgi:hypothetical protein